jgi:hypothetical protein
MFWGAVHGIERQSGQACEALINDIKNNPNDPLYQDISIAIVPYYNVDGVANDTYDGAHGWSLQIDSMARYTIEGRNMFNFIDFWKPQITLDGHNLDAWDRGSSNYMFDHVPRIRHQADLVYRQTGLQYGPHKWTWRQFNDFINTLNASNSPYKYDRFWKIDDEGYSWVDGDNDPARIHLFCALRYNTLSFLCEGISPYQVEDYSNETEEFRDAQATQSAFKFMKSLITFAKQNHLGYMCQNVATLPIGYEFPVRWEQILEKEQVFRSTRNTNSSQLINIPTASHTIYWEPTEYVTMPLGYAYPNTDEFGLVTYYLGPAYRYNINVGTSTDRYEIETIHVINATQGTRFDDPVTQDKAWQFTPHHVTTINIDSTMTDFSEYVIILCDQPGGNYIPHLLEPKAQHALTRYYEETGLLVLPDTDYPVKRLMKRLA